LIPVLDVPSAVRILKRGGVIAYPTETFYGLGCDATLPKAVQKLFELKGRPADNPIPVLIHSREALPYWVRDVPEGVEALMEKCWPGPLTLVFWAKEGLPGGLLAGTGKIALRISSHPLARSLVHGLGLPLTTTSANRSGSPPARSAEEVRNAFQNIEGIVDGGVLPPSRGSTILDVTVDPPKILREGEISREALFKE
jgi:L-threonylcarbamoyladenylate synthase